MSQRNRTSVTFEVPYRFDVTPRALWDAMVDWQAHGEWIPMTRVHVDPGDPTAVGATFTAWTGPGRLALEDRMRVAECHWDDDTHQGTCTVEKLGPVLRGRAGFTVTPDGGGSALLWFEDVTVPVVPRVLAPLVARLSAAGFRQGMGRLARRLHGSPTPARSG